MEPLSLISFNESEIAYRLILAMFLGAVIGLERQVTNKSAGLRTQMLVCLGSTIFTILSIYGFAGVIPEGIIIQNDPARIAAQILTGIGFIGGGVILKSEGNVYGITTAASLWIVASIGMAVGTGAYTLAITGTFISVLVLFLMRIVEKKFLDKYTRHETKVKVELTTNLENLTKIDEQIHKHFGDLQEVRFSTHKDDKETVHLDFIVKAKGHNAIHEVYKQLKELENLHAVNVSPMPSLSE